MIRNSKSSLGSANQVCLLPRQRGIHTHPQWRVPSRRRGLIKVKGLCRPLRSSANSGCVNSETRRQRTYRHQICCSLVCFLGFFCEYPNILYFHREHKRMCGHFGSVTLPFLWRNQFSKEKGKAISLLWCYSLSNTFALRSCSAFLTVCVLNGRGTHPHHLNTCILSLWLN